MELNEFAQALKDGIQKAMPRESDYAFQLKHKGRAGKMSVIALGNNQVMSIANKGVYFELGNATAETHTPQYHILEDARVIHKRGKSTKVSRGSQAKVLPSERDYGQWTIKAVASKNGTTKIKTSQEYRKYVRNERELVKNGTRKVTDYNGKSFLINRQANYYVNEHYHYIENILDNSPLLDNLASQFGLKRGKRGIDTDIEIKSQIEEDNKKLSSSIASMLANSPTY